MNDAIFPPELSLALAEFGRWSNEHLGRLQQDTRIIQPLYHYTGGAGLLGIITSQQLWFTNYLHLNDPSELRYGMGIARSLLLEAGERFADSLIDLFTATTERLCRDENLDGPLDFYIASFSRDSNDLGQWRSYADDGQGFALGLAPHLFHVDEKTDRKPHEYVFVMPVDYGESQALARYREAIEAAAAVVQDNRRFLENITPQAQVRFITAKDGIRSLLYSFHDDPEGLISKSGIPYRHF